MRPVRICIRSMQTYRPSHLFTQQPNSTWPPAPAGFWEHICGHAHSAQRSQGSRSCSTAMARRCPVLPITKQLAKHKLINHLCLPVRSMIPEIFNLKIFPFRNPDAAVSATLFFICFQVFFSISVLPGLHSICVWAFDALLFSDSFFNRGKGIYSLYFIASSYGEYYHFFTFWKSSDAGMS